MVITDDLGSSDVGSIPTGAVNSEMSISKLKIQRIKFNLKEKTIMTKETMTVHKALAEIKILKGRIQSEIYNSVFVSCKKNSQSKISGMDVDEYEKVITGCYDKDVDLMSRLEALQRAVMLSNAVTKVTVNGKECTVAEAICMKNNDMAFKKMMLSKMEQQLDQTQVKTNKENEALDSKSENYVTGMFGQKEGKTSSDEVAKSKQQYIDLNTWTLVDPINVQNKIRVLSDEISSFEAEVDSVLSTSNALTTVTIEY